MPLRDMTEYMKMANDWRSALPPHMSRVYSNHSEIDLNSSKNSSKDRLINEENVEYAITTFLTMLTAGKWNRLSEVARAQWYGRLGFRAECWPEDARDLINLQELSEEIDGCAGRSVIFTKSEKQGLAPPRARPGDLLVWFDGSDFPFVLRPAEKQDSSDQEYEIIGDIYVSNFDAAALMTDSLVHTTTFMIR
ncbi:uncharacterized protein BDZ99DRAFT_463560 [Mytilinidion resinicola]|uniref:Uncharacterized protein n=1 Tax=Mytilinidion resinicola TaxID=574789 RepID=A0A6A6YPA9_9PEZI|nr:uncharacterized protein BDZ99DRAFT_463560 [Mytilinidion resinicola]KAF2809815.1 hypothetical protein BDZ99DRAFT_463560 [Mytilinidion resinicola]